MTKIDFNAFCDVDQHRPLPRSVLPQDIEASVLSLQHQARGLGQDAQLSQRAIGARLERACARILSACHLLPSDHQTPTSREYLTFLIGNTLELARFVGRPGAVFSARVPGLALHPQTAAHVYRIVLSLVLNAATAPNRRAVSSWIIGEHRGSDVVLDVMVSGVGLGAWVAAAGDTTLPETDLPSGERTAARLAERIGGRLTVIRNVPEGAHVSLRFPAAPPNDIV
ncbi:MAG: hypothetical protein AAF376_00910 [Pseudomonadota bacterium]